MLKILIIEDESPIREMLIEEICEMGHTAEGVSDGFSGIERIKIWNPDIILCDIGIPGMSGLQLKKKLNEESAGRPAATFVFVSAYNADKDVADGLMLGADHYIKKPIDFDKLGALLESARRP